MTHSGRFPVASLLAVLLGSAALTPAQAQLGGLLGDADVTSGNAAPAQGGQGSPAAPRKHRAQETRSLISPYIEIDQGAIWNLKGGNGEVLTYTTVAAGVTASVQTHNVAIGADVRYEHQFAWKKNSPDQDVISGIANARVDVLRNMLSMEAGGMATRVRTDGIRGANTSLAGASVTNRMYSAYIGPNFSAPIGDLTVTAAYRFGYNRLESRNGAAAALGLPVTGAFEDSTIHNANASVGMQPGILPFGWAVGVGYLREDASQLAQRYDSKFARADVTVPISPYVALVGGVGYEKIKISNKDALRDANGVPVTNGNGYVTDPASPRRLSYDNDGVIWDAGVQWRPSPRLSAEARVGHRYGSMSYTGSLRWRAGQRTGVAVSVFDSVDSFGRSINSSLANLGTDFYVIRNPFSGDLGSCAFVTDKPGGACFNDALTGISTANYRNRGIYAQVSRSGDSWSISAAAGYSNRRFIADSQSVLAAANGLVDKNYFSTVGVSHNFDSQSTFDVMGYWNYFDSGVPGVADVVNIGANASYRRAIWRRLQASAAVGIDSVDRKGQEAFITLLAQIGLRYQF